MSMNKEETPNSLAVGLKHVSNAGIHIDRDDYGIATYSFSNGQLFAKHYMISYVITNCESYFVLVILIIFKHHNSTGLIIYKWIPLIYSQYMWVYFGKMYHNEIVRYFQNTKSKKRIDNIVFWLKVIVFSSLGTIWYWIYMLCISKQKDAPPGEETVYLNVGIAHLFLSFLMFVNSVATLKCFTIKIS